jgi:N-ethylmaleimide reductase
VRVSDPLFKPLQAGELQLRNRIIMSPMTRTRAGAGDVPTDLMVEYYRQRASAGLIVTEGTSPSAEAKGYWRMPGIWSEAQTAGWKKVADAVHAEGGRIVMQLMHCGRVVVPENRLYEADVIAPSALPCPDPVMGPEGKPLPCAMPRALRSDEMPRIAAEYAQAARSARAAGIDGVELHCASGYLINQFLNPHSNQRSDEYGGSAQNRARLPLMVLQAMADAIGAGRVGVRIAPGNPYNGMQEADPLGTFSAFIQGFEPMGLAYVHLMNVNKPELDGLGMVRQHYSGPILNNNMLTPESARELLASGRADAASFGRPFISNPDLVRRLQIGAALNPVDFSHTYVGEEKGYTDYPFLPA